MLESEWCHIHTRTAHRPGHFTTRVEGIGQTEVHSGFGQHIGLIGHRKFINSHWFRNMRTTRTVDKVGIEVTFHPLIQEG
ncbi:hypothetical protein D3C72_811700 [compost metagenome]